MPGLAGRDERMEFGPTLFPWVMLLPLFLSLISPAGPGGCEDLAAADPKSCPLCVLGIPADGLGLGSGQFNFTKTSGARGAAQPFQTPGFFCFPLNISL